MNMTPAARPIAADAELIHAYAHGMDLKRFDLATGVLAPECEIDYSSVGGPKGRMTREEVATFLTGLLGDAGLSVHTAIQQVLPSPTEAETTIAYYSVRHFRRKGERQGFFFVYGWYEFATSDGLIDRLTIRNKAMEGTPSILG